MRPRCVAWVYRVSCWRGLCAVGGFAVGAAYFIASSIGGAAWAEDGWATSAKPARPIQTYEAWAGADVSTPGWSVYGGMTAALFGDVRDSGWRLRGAASYGEYRYSRSYWDATAQQDVQLQFIGHRRTLDTLLGYQFAWGPATVKAFAGLTQEQKLDTARQGSPIALDDENGFQGDRSGVKLALETWTRLADWGFLQADASWSEPSESSAARVRLGYRIGPSWATGLELAAYGNLIPDQGRAGAFVRFEWSRGEISLSAGTAGDRLRTGESYGTINAMLRF